MSTRTLFPVILGSGGPSGNYAVNLNMTMDSNYIISAQLVDQNGDALGTEQTIDLPLESVVVGGSYDSSTQSLILTLDNGQSITIPVSGLISGLQATIDSNNPLNVDYTTDGTTNKVYTAAEQSKLSGIAAGAEVNVQSDWNQSDSTADDYIKNKPTLGTMASESASDYTKTSSLATVATTGSYPDLHNRPTIPTVNDATITLQDDGGTTIDSFTLNQSSNKTITIPSGGGGSNQWFGTQIQFDNLGTYDEDTDYFISDKIDYDNDIKHKPNLTVYATKTEVNTKNLQQDTEIAGKLSGHFMTQAEFDALGNNVPEGENYFIEGNTVQMVVTFTDQSTATYNVVVD